MEALLSFAGVVGAVCCVAMYALVSMGRIDADKPVFFAVNGVGAVLVLVGASHQLDMGDLGTVGQELTWACLSLYGAARAWVKSGGMRSMQAKFARVEIAPSML